LPAFKIGVKRMVEELNKLKRAKKVRNLIGILFFG
jgi:hypothetical protein